MTPPTNAKEFLPVRLKPGDDLRGALEAVGCGKDQPSAFVISGIGSLVAARLRFAGQENETLIAGPLEIVSIAGSITADGAHLHMTVSDSAGRVSGGHVCDGNIIRTTLEAVLILLPAWSLTREVDTQTGFKELVARPRSHANC
ncbi:PPC domain-containing DNA-binding protein [Massilia sp. TSP1-1-2]|uniref:PPC domain-containing DNA-binding protein n=1 Tax=unclassified Massilia TaxID=2609279 RepID=UPI003CF6932E